MVQRVNEVSRIQNNEQQRALAYQQGALRVAREQSEISMNQVKQSEETSNVAIRERNEKQKQQTDNKKKKGKPGDKREESKSRSKNVPSGSTIDIRL